MRDIHAPFIAEDGLEYQDFGDFLLGKPVACFRNDHIQKARKAGRSEESIRLWIKGYDGNDPTPSCRLDQEARVQRQVRANFAVHPFGGPVANF